MLYNYQIERQTRGLRFFKGVFACDQLPEINEKPATLIINTDPSEDEGEHWVAMHLHADGRADYFCPLGFPPLIPQIQAFFNRHSPGGMRYNCCTMQDLNFSHCGDFCICFVKCVAKGIHLPQFVRRFSSDVERNKRMLTCVKTLSR